MRRFDKPIHFYAVLSDPSDPTRPSAWQVDVRSFLDMEDGTPPEPVGSVRTLSVAQAEQEGLTLTDVLTALNVEALAVADALRARVQELTEQVEYLTSNPNR